MPHKEVARTGADGVRTPGLDDGDEAQEGGVDPVDLHRKVVGVRHGVERARLMVHVEDQGVLGTERGLGLVVPVVDEFLGFGIVPQLPPAPRQVKVRLEQPGAKGSVCERVCVYVWTKWC